MSRATLTIFLAMFVAAVVLYVGSIVITEVEYLSSEPNVTTDDDGIAGRYHLRGRTSRFFRRG